MYSMNLHIFQKARIIILASICVFSLVWTVFVSVYLAEEWRDYNNAQRIIVLSLVVVKGITGILLYLLAAISFRLLMDAARIGFLLLVQLGSTIPFTILGTKFPCTSFGSGRVCTRVSLWIFIGCWVMNGLLFGYVLSLLATACILRNLSPAALPASSESMQEAGLRASRVSTNSQTTLIQPHRGRRPPSLLLPPRSARRLFIVNKTPSPSDASPSVLQSQQMRHPPVYDTALYTSQTSGNESLDSLSDTIIESTPTRMERASLYPSRKRSSLPATQSTRSSRPPPLQLPNPYGDSAPSLSSYHESASSIISSPCSIYSDEHYDYTRGTSYVEPPVRALVLTFERPSFPSPSSNLSLTTSQPLQWEKRIPMSASPLLSRDGDEGLRDPSAFQTNACTAVLPSIPSMAKDLRGVHDGSQNTVPSFLTPITGTAHESPSHSGTPVATLLRLNAPRHMLRAVDGTPRRVLRATDRRWN